MRDRREKRRKRDGRDLAWVGDDAEDAVCLPDVLVRHGRERSMIQIQGTAEAETKQLERSMSARALSLGKIVGGDSRTRFRKDGTEGMDDARPTRRHPHTRAPPAREILCLLFTTQLVPPSPPPPRHALAKVRRKSTFSTLAYSYRRALSFGLAQPLSAASPDLTVRPSVARTDNALTLPSQEP
jgi:hypothetical protein